MRDISILFQGSMVLAIYRGDKRQTRREVKPQPWVSCTIEDGMKGETPFVYSALGGDGPGHDVLEVRSPCRCPYGVPGDVLLVRETFFAWGRWETRFSEKKGRDEWHFIDMTLDAGKAYRYAVADPLAPTVKPGPRGGVAPAWWRRPAIFMPRAAVRLRLRVEEVRVQRLQEISEADARAEGITDGGCNNCGGSEPCGCSEPAPDARESFAELWMSINGPSSWASNPWVWAVSFVKILEHV